MFTTNSVLISAHAQAFAQSWPAAAEAAGDRLPKAIEIAIRSAISQIDDHTYSVSSSSRPDVVYVVDTRSKTCTCPDAAKRAGKPCKHRLAVALSTGWLSDPDEIALVAGLVRDASDRFLALIELCNTKRNRLNWLVAQRRPWLSADSLSLGYADICAVDAQYVQCVADYQAAWQEWVDLNDIYVSLTGTPLAPAPAPVKVRTRADEIISQLGY